jgi:hypothetical protein
VVATLQGQLTSTVVDRYHDRFDDDDDDDDDDDS